MMRIGTRSLMRVQFMQLYPFLRLPRVQSQVRKIRGQMCTTAMIHALFGGSYIEICIPGTGSHCALICALMIISLPKSKESSPDFYMCNPPVSDRLLVKITTDKGGT